MLYLEAGSGEGPEASIERLEQQAAVVGERISLAIANLRLREALRTQSIRDPLTGLFNRRYMEETLERELSRAARNEQAVALLMFDLDHFKRFNDTFGHQAGDVLLRALGDFLMHRTRGQDVPCRFGGEEFAVILAGADIEGAQMRAEVLREEVKTLTVQHAGQVLGRISLSAGVAVFPHHGRQRRNSCARPMRPSTAPRAKVATAWPWSWDSSNPSLPSAWLKIFPRLLSDC